LRIEIAEEPLIKTRESYREIALRGAICFEVIASLKALNCNYMLSFKKFKSIFDDSLYQFERSSTPQVISKLTLNIYNCVARMLSESDRKMFVILLSMEIEAAAGRLRPGEKEFVIAPAFGLALQTMLNKQLSEHKYLTHKKPFDWMSEEQFQNLQYLAISHSWFSEPFDRMGRDGRETQWRSLCETETPENAALPDKLDESLNPIQRFCIIRAVRGERILHLALAFVSCVLGKK
jgi:dynein heavy chain